MHLIRTWSLINSSNSSNSAAWVLGSEPCVLTHRRNFSWSRSIALVIRSDFHWLRGNR